MHACAYAGKARHAVTLWHSWQDKLKKGDQNVGQGASTTRTVSKSCMLEEVFKRQKIFNCSCRRLCVGISCNYLQSVEIFIISLALI